jgi:hypothetical protein
MVTATRYSASDSEVIDTSVSGVVNFFLSLTRDRRSIDYLLAMDAQDDWAVDRDETAHRDPVVQTALHTLAGITSHTQYFTPDMTVQFLALLGSLTTSRSIYIYCRSCEKNPRLVMQVEQCLLQYKDRTSDIAVLVSALIRRIDTVRKVNLMNEIYTEERMNNIIKILLEQSL